MPNHPAAHVEDMRDQGDSGAPVEQALLDGGGFRARLAWGSPDSRGTVLAFPFVDHGQIVNTKYRGTRTKKFWQSYASGRVESRYAALVHGGDTESARPNCRRTGCRRGERDWWAAHRCASGSVARISPTS